jgi:hypothetical protein
MCFFSVQAAGGWWAADLRLVSGGAPRQSGRVMKMFRFFRVPVAAVVVGVMMSLSSPCEARSPNWEYLVVNAGLKNRNLELMLNERGAEGWELVAVTRKDVAVFKRVAR